MGSASGIPLLSIACIVREKQLALKAYKVKVDPNNILNPGKSFSRGSKGISGLIFHPAVFNFLIQLLMIIGTGNRYNANLSLRKK